MKIIRCNASHAGILSKISKESFLYSHGKSASQEDIDAFIKANYNPDTFAQELLKPENLYHIIYNHEQPVGYSKVIMNSGNEHMAAQNVTKLDRLYLLKEFHGQNLGAKLFDFNVELSKNQQQKGIWLAVWKENLRALAFYKKNGFQIVGTYDFKISETHSNPNHIMFLEY